jgi:hypothetical protein
MERKAINSSRKLAASTAAMISGTYFLTIFTSSITSAVPPPTSTSAFTPSNAAGM